MSKLKVKKSQIIACAVLVIVAIICGCVGVYGMSSRSSEKGSAILSSICLLYTSDAADE